MGLTSTMEKELEEKGKALSEQVKGFTAEYVKANTDPLVKRLETLEKNTDTVATKAEIAAIKEELKKEFEKFVVAEATKKKMYSEIWKAGDEYRQKHDKKKLSMDFPVFLNSIFNCQSGHQALKRLETLEKTFQTEYPEIKEVFRVMGENKSFMNMGSPQDGGFTVPTPMLMEYIEALYAQTYFDKVGIRRLAIPNGYAKLPKVGAKASATYGDEGAPIDPTAPKFDELVFQAKKLTAMIPYTRELFFASPLGIENIIMDDIRRVMLLKKEYTGLYGAGTALEPSGVSNQLTSAQKLGSSSTPFTRDTPLQMLAEIESTNIPPDFSWLMHPQMFYYIMNLKSTTGQFIYRDEMSKGTLCGYPIAKTTQSSYTYNATYANRHADIWIGNWSNLIMGVFREMEALVSDQGTYVTSGGEVISAVQRGLILITLTDHHDFQIRYPEAFIQGHYKFSET